MVNFSTWNHVFVFWTLPSSVFHLLFFSSLSRPHSLFVPCCTDNKRFLTLLFLIFFYQPSFWVSKKQIVVLLLDKSFKKYHWYSFYHLKIFFCFSWLSSIFAFEFVFSRMIFKNILLFFFVFTFFFERYLGSFVLISLFLFKKKITFKKSDSLNFSLVFLLTLFSLFCFVSLCLLSLLLVFSLHAFSLFFSSFFLFPWFLSLGLPLAMFIYSLSLVLPLLIPFFLKIHFYLFFFFLQKKKDLLFHLFIPFL